MKNNKAVIILLALAQFVMVLDSTVMNVSISAVVKDLNTSISAMQMAITFYTLTMASFMLLGGKLGDVFGRKKAFLIGSVVYATGSFITAISPNIGTLMFGWSLVEGLGAIMVIPAIAALVAVNYSGKDRAVAYAIIGAISGAAAAAGPLIGGFVTTYLSWRYVFISEVVIMALILIFSKSIKESKPTSKSSIDLRSVILSFFGFFTLVFGMLQSKSWGWMTPRGAPVINGKEITPLGVSLVVYLIVGGIALLYMFYRRQVLLTKEGKEPLLDVSMFSIKQLRAGLGVLSSQYFVIAGVFFLVPVYLQTVLGYDALKTGVKILPLSIAVIVFSVLGTKLALSKSIKKIVRLGQVLLIIGALVLVQSVSTSLDSQVFLIGMFVLGSGLGLLASQLGNINMSSVPEKKSAEVGGLQGVAQNIGSSFGTALIGSVLVATLTTAFVSNVQASSLPSNVKTYITQNSTAGVQIVTPGQVQAYALSKNVPEDQATQITDTYISSQIDALRQAFTIIAVIATLTMLFSRNIPKKVA
ncbi:MAG: MFS transporter [Candidatus Saccharimonadales bacterium]